MFKKFFSLLLLCGMMSRIVAEEVCPENDTVEPVIELQDKELAGLFSFEVKKTDVFEDFIKSLSVESKTELQDFINKVEQDLLNNVDFIELVKKYQDLFIQLKVVKKNLPKVTLIFSFDKENWVDLVKQEELNFDVLKNGLSEDQLSVLVEELNEIMVLLKNIGSTVLAVVENSDFKKEFKSKSGNQKFRIGLILV